MQPKKFSITNKDTEMTGLVGKTDQKTLAVWAIECAYRVLPFFEKQYPEDPRPRKAIETLKEWLKTGEFHMAAIRNASLDAHRAAKEIGNDSSAASAAHAAGQCVATAHVPRHAYGSAIYAQQAVFRANPSDPQSAASRERNWQYTRLKRLERY